MHDSHMSAELSVLANHKMYRTKMRGQVLYKHEDPHTRISNASVTQRATNGEATTQTVKDQHIKFLLSKFCRLPPIHGKILKLGGQ